MNSLSRVLKISVWWLALSGGILVQLGLARCVRAQESARQAQLEEVEGNLAVLWAQVHETPESFQAWNILLTSETMAVHARAWAEGLELSPEQLQILREEARQRVLKQWREARPQDAGPELVLIFAISGPGAQEEALLDLVERFPSDPVPVERAAMARLNRGDQPGARVLLEDFLRRSSDNPAAYRLLVSHEQVLGNSEKASQWLLRWVELAPSDPVLLSTWLSSGMDDREPRRTAELVARRLATIEPDERTLGLCSKLARKRNGAFQSQGRSCLAQLAARTDKSNLANRAAMTLTELTVAEGDWSRAMEAIGELPDELRLQTTLRIVNRIPVPDGCKDRIRLVRGLLPQEGGHEEAVSLAHSLFECAGRTGARALFVQLLREAPARKLRALVDAWSWELNGAIQGELPAESAEVVAERLREEPTVKEAWGALERIYRVEGRHEARLSLLQRWRRSLPDSFRNSEALQLADELVRQERFDEAAAFLRGRLNQGHDGRLSEELRKILIVSGNVDASRQVVRDLENRGDEDSLALAHYLSARLALEQGDARAAEGAAWAQIDSARPRRESALILLTLATQAQGEESAGRLAARLCADYRHALDLRGNGNCAASLLMEIGSASAAKAALAQGQQKLPDNVQGLRSLGASAKSLEDWQLAERIFERMLELESKRKSGGWVGLAQVYSGRRDLGALEQLLTRGRRELESLPVEFLIALGRGHLQLDSPRRAIDLLLEARTALPEGSEPAYINADLRKAYTAFGGKEE